MEIDTYLQLNGRELDLETFNEVLELTLDRKLN